MRESSRAELVGMLLAGADVVELPEEGHCGSPTLAAPDNTDTVEPVVDIAE